MGSAMARIRKRDREKAEEVLRIMLKRQYPIVEAALDELAESHLYGDNRTLLEALVEVARERVMELMAQKHPLVAQTIVEMHKRVQKVRRKKRL